MGICDINIYRPGRGNIKDVAAPLALPHDLFAWLIAQQARVWTNLLAVVHHASANDDFQVGPVLPPAGLFFEQFSSEIEFLGDFLKRVLAGNDFRHAARLSLRMRRENRLLLRSAQGIFRPRRSQSLLRRLTYRFMARKT